MNPQDLLKTSETKMQGAIAHFEGELKKLRTGRANPSMLDGVMAEAYGQPMPLIQLATITTPEPQLLQISPFDPNTIESISAAIRENQALGLNPSDDGRIIRVSIPPLTQERRQQIVKQLNEKVEECMIALRNVRHETLKEFDKAKKDKDISEDEYGRYTKQLEEAMSSAKAEADEVAKAKETEIMTL